MCESMVGLSSIGNEQQVCLQGLKALFPSCGGPGAVEITPADMARLEPDEFLNDTIIDFFMRCTYSPGPKCRAHNDYAKSDSRKVLVA